MNKIKTHIFDNGFTLVYQQSQQKLPIASMYAYVRVGSINENDENRGASHFIEHMCFKGTRKIKNSDELYTSYNKVGAVFNAFTEKDHTCFFAQCGDEYMQNCLNIMSDMMLHSVFKEKEYKLETPIVLEEMIRAEDEPDTNLFKEINRFLYNGTPYSNPVDDILYHRKKNPYHYQQTIDYYREYYRPENIVLSIVSSFSFVKIKEVLSKTFFIRNIQKIPRIREPVHRINLSCLAIPTNGNEITYQLLEKKGMTSQHLCISYRTCNHSDPDRYILNVLRQIVGGGMGSRLYMLLREENGLTYESSCSSDYFLVGGEFIIYAVLDPTKLYKNGAVKKGVLPLIVDLIRKLVREGITKTELDIAKGNYKGKLLLQQEKNGHIAAYNGLQQLLYSNESAVEYCDIYSTYYENITVQQVNDVIRKYFTVPSNICVSIIGEKNSHFPTLEKLKRICKI